jgi:hypothetical protein
MLTSMESKLTNTQKLVHKSMSTDAVLIMLFLQLISKPLTCHQKLCLLISRNGSLTLTAVKNHMEVSSLTLSVLIQLTESLFSMQMNSPSAQIVPAISTLRIQSKVNLSTYGLTLMVSLILHMEDQVTFLNSSDATVLTPLERSLLTLKKLLFLSMILML